MTTNDPRDGGLRRLALVAGDGPKVQRNGQDDEKLPPTESILQNNGRRGGGGGASQATRLVDLALAAGVDLFHDPEGEPYATFTAPGGQRETHRLRSRAVRDWLASRYYAAQRAIPNAQAIADATAALGGQARFEGPCRPVSVRLAGHGQTIYLDTGAADWSVIEIAADDWRVIPAAQAPVRFRRPKGLLALPTPKRGGSLEALRPFVNVRKPAGVGSDPFLLIGGWLLGALRPAGPYPLLCLHGEAGTAKTMLGRMLRATIDPNVVPLRSEPRDETDLLIAARNGLVVAFDNLSHLSDRFSDALCRLASGGGLSKRELYSDADETLLDATRPVLITGIEVVLTRGDAVDRALLVELERIPDDRRRTEEELWAEFEAARPAVLGALLTGASTALRNRATTRLERPPRMADFATWVEAGAPGLNWPAEAFLTTYSGNRDDADELAIEALPVGPVVRAFVQEQAAEGFTRWEGTATTLLPALGERAGERATKARDWPQKPHTLSAQLKRLAPHLRRLGIDVETGIKESGGRRRLVRLELLPQNGGAKVRPKRPERHEPRQQAELLPGQASQSGHGASQIAVRASQPEPGNLPDDGDFAEPRDAWDAGDADPHDSSQGDEYKR